MRTKLVIAAVATAAAVSAVGASAYTESITGGQGTQGDRLRRHHDHRCGFRLRPMLHYSAGSTRSPGSTSS